MSENEREKLRKKLREVIRFYDKPKLGANYVIYNDKEEYITVDPCGWPVFDDKLYPRTTRFTKEDAEIYVRNLKANRIFGLKIKKIGELNENK